MVIRFRRAVECTGYWVSITLLLAASLPLVAPAVPAAATTTCHVINLDPHNVPDGSFTGFAFTFTDSVRDIAWAKITAPSANIVIVNASSDWLPQANVSSSDATFTGSPIGAGNQLTAHIDAIVSAFPADHWLVQTSTDQSGSNPLTCDGDTNISVTTNTPPLISGLTASPGITTAIIMWQTDKPATSHVDYGTTSAYTDNADDSSYAASHRLTLTGLMPATAYHYQVTSVDQLGNSSTSLDGTFMTQPTPPPPPPPTGGGSTGTGGTGGTPSGPNPQPSTPTTANTPLGLVVTNARDKTPPSISLTTTLSSVSNAEPTLRGTASDESAVARIEYSTDGAKNWLMADMVSGLGSKKVTFAVTPPHLEDGLYSFVVRAIDSGGNIATSTTLTTVIDRQPPTVGAAVVSLGAQPIVPDSAGILTLTAGVDLNIHTSAVGGATRITLLASNPRSPLASPASFSLVHDTDSGLWGGVLSFTRPGAYLLRVHSLDGAGNTADREIAHLIVQAPGIILSSSGPVSTAIASVYYLDPDTNSWQLWDATPFNQTNPQRSGKTGGFRLVVSAGTYYIRVTAPGYQTLTTDQFTVTTPTALAPRLQLTVARPIISGLQALVSSTALAYPAATTASSLAQLFTAFKPSDTLLANLQLSTTAGGIERSTEWLGKPTVLCATTTWAPSTEALLGPLAQLESEGYITVRAIGLQQNIAQLSAYRAVSGSPVTWLADPDGTMFALGANIVPTCYFTGSKGNIEHVTYGVLSYDELLRTLNVF